jgi:hypothetical protein
MPGSSDCGAVPYRNVTVPPVFPAGALELEAAPDDELLDELPHAATAIAAISASAVAATDLRVLLIASS